MEPISPLPDKQLENPGVSPVGEILAIPDSQAKMLMKAISADVPVGIAILQGPEYIFQFVNNAYLPFVDRNAEDLIGRSLFDAIPELKGQEVEQILTHVFKTGESYRGSEFEAKLVREGKKQSVYFTFVYSPLKNDDGVVESIMVVASEVPGLVERRHALLQKEAEFRKYVMQSPIAMTVFRGPEYIVEMANPEMYKGIWRKEEKDVLGKKALEVFPELNGQKYPELLRRVFNTGLAYREMESPTFVQGDDGMKKFYLDFDYAPLFEPDGAVSGIMITVTNVTERVEARQKLEDAEARLRLATEGVGLATWDLDIVTNELKYSSRLALIFGRDPARTYQFEDFRSQIFQEDIDKIVLPAYEQALKSSIYFYQARVTRPENSIRWISTRGKVIYDETGKPVRLLGTVQDITDEKTLSDDTAQLAAIIQSSEDAIVSKTVNGIVTSWNPGAEKLFGYTKEEMIGASILKIIPEDRFDEEPKIVNRILAGESVDHFDTIRKTKDGKLIDISLTISPIRDRYGRITGASKIARNITAQKALNMALHESEQRLQIAVASAELGTWELDLKTKETVYSARYLEILGFDKDAQPLHEELLTRIHPEDRAARDKATVTALRTGTLDIEMRLIHPDRSIRWIRARGKAFFDNENVPERMLGTIIDITEQKNAYDAIQESELQFKTIANVSPVGLWMTNREGMNNFVNDTWMDWTGMSLGEQAGTGWLGRVVKEDAEKVTAEFRKAAASREYFISEFRIKRKDGQLKWCLSEGFPYFNNNGEFEGYAGSVTDITERKIVEADLEKKVKERTRELNLTNTALEKSNSELEQFAYIASHDLQEPLRKIKTFIGRLQELNAEKNDPQATVYMDKIINASGRMSDLIRDLLEYSRTAKVTETPAEVDLNEIITNVLSDFELRISQKAAVIKADKLPVIRAVPHQMNQLFNNLVSNSLKFSKDNDSPVISISNHLLSKDEIDAHNLDVTRGYVEIVFADNGIGFSNEFSDRVFEIFQRLNPRHAYAGSGIGLSICRKIVTNHQGLIMANSSEGEGTSFHIILPLE